MTGLPPQIPAPEQEIIFYQLAENARAEIYDTQTKTRGLIYKALCPTDKELLGIPSGDAEELYTMEHIAKLVLGHFYGPEIAAKYHDDLLNERLLPIMEGEGGRISSQDIYEWLQGKMEVDQDSGLAPR